MTASFNLLRVAASAALVLATSGDVSAYARPCTWTGGSRVALPQSVAPGASVTFTIPITAPASAGTYNFQWSMVQDGQPVSTFGALSTNVAIVVIVAAPQTFIFKWDYDVNGHVSQLTYPDNTIVTYNPNALGEVAQVGAYASGVSYHPTGAITGFTYGNGITHSQSLNTRQLPQARSDASVMNDSYTYDPNGNILSITDNQQNISTRNLGYDNLDRLITANAPNMWGNASYTYDGIDNLKVSTIGATVVTRNYDAATNRLSSLSQTGGTSPGITSISYDAQGNVSQRAGQAFNFDLGNRLMSATGKASYNYDGLGRRTRITQADGTIKLQIYSQAGQILYGVQSGGPNAAATAAVTKYIYLGTREIAEVKTLTSTSIATTQYVHTDALGSPVAHTGSSAAIIDRSRYEPYGANAAFGGGIAPNGIGFTGHVNDVDTALVYMQQRYYDPVAGRFLSLDQKLTDTETGSAFNRYVYVNNNPLRYTDPDGRDSVGEIIDKKAMEAAQQDSGWTYAWAFAATGWSVGGAEGISQVADKGSGASTGDKISAVVEVVAGVGGAVFKGIGLAAKAALSEAPVAAKGLGAIEGAVSSGARTEARTLAEQLSLKEAEAGAGGRIMEGKINDPRFPGDAWKKMEHIHSTPGGQDIVIHYWERIVDTLRTGFKFKD